MTIFFQVAKPGIEHNSYGVDVRDVDDDGYPADEPEYQMVLWQVNGGEIYRTTLDADGTLADAFGEAMATALDILGINGEAGA